MCTHLFLIFFLIRKFWIFLNSKILCFVSGAKLLRNCCCLTWHSSCEASLFTIWNLSQVVILKLERCGFLFLETYSVFHNSVLFIFLNSKILCFVSGAKLLRNFKWLSCKVSSVTLWNASEVTILEQERCGFLHFEVYLVSNNSLFLFCFKWEILRFIRELFSFFLNFEKYIFFFFFGNGLYVRNINNKELWRY